MSEIILLGKGGQGVVIAGEILAKALFYQGFFIQAFPSFGTERRGAPVRSFVRFDNQVIKKNYAITVPDYALIFNPGQANEIKPRVAKLVNSQEMQFSYPIIDANHIALKYQLGTETNPIINTVMVGGLAALLGNLEFQNIEKAIQETLPKNLWEKNIQAATQSFDLVRQMMKQGMLLCA